MKPVIRAERLTRYFGSHAVVRDLDLDVPHGKVTALLGLNGAGKTTTIRMLVGLLWPTRGRCWTLGRDSRDLRGEDLSRIGYMVEGHYFYPWMRVGEVQRFTAEGHPRWDSLRFDSVVRHFGIDRTQRVGELSRGQRAGVCLASTLAADPELMILDDPALGLDPVSRRALNETLVEFASDNGRTVLLSSHLIDDVERVADRVAVMADGRLMVDTTLDDFRRRVSRWSLRFDGGESIALTGVSGLAVVPGLIEAHQLRDRLVISLADVDDESLAAVDRLGAAERERIPMTLDDAVIAYLARDRSERSFLLTKAR